MIHATTTISDYRRFRVGQRRIIVHREFARFASEILPANEYFDGLRGPFVKVKSSDTARVFKCRINFGGRCLNLYLKQHLYRCFRDYLKHFVRPSRAMREFKAALMLARNGIGAPPVVAVGSIRAGLFHSRNFLITARLEHARSLYLWLEHDMPVTKAQTLQSRRSLIRQLGAAIGRMHARGICHGDLRPGNVFVENESGRWNFFLLDNERTMKLPFLPKRFIIKNLVQIGMLYPHALSLTDRVRFLRAWLVENPRMRADYKSFAMKVFSRTRRRMSGK